MDETKKDKYFDIIYSSAGELSQMIDNLLEYSRTGSIQEEQEKVNLSKILGEVAQQFDDQLEKINGEIQVNTGVDTVQVYPILFKRLLTNLISNSIKYRGIQQPEIKISCKETGDLVLFQVQDNGMGIPENQYGNIFKIFKSLSPNNDSNGIGLSVCKKIVEVHGGRMWVESKVNEGTTFFFEIKTEG
jgi:two-component system CheB/CheR fusion protein